MENPIEEIIEIFQSKLSILNSEENLSQSLLTEHDKILMAYIQTVSHYIQNSKFTTIYGLYSSIEQVTESFIKKMIEKKIISKFDIAISLQAAGQVINHLLHKFISKKISEDLNVIQQYLINIINDLLLLNKLSYEKINKFFDHTIRNGTKILVHGYSSHIIYSLIESSKKGKKFFVYITSSQPDDYSKILEEKLKENNINCKIIPGISVGYYLKYVNFVLTNANAVCQNGGIINKIGTLTIAICAKNFKIPFYVMSDSLKFFKMYVLDQTDLKHSLGFDINQKNDNCDFTDSEFISLYFTDIGIFTPSAICDELIHLFNN